MLIDIEADREGWRKRSLLSLRDVNSVQMHAVLKLASTLKKNDLARRPALYWNYPRTLAMLFEKPSLRTRVSFEVSMSHLRGHAIYLSPTDVGLGSREAVPDVAATLSRWVDIITARVFSHEIIEQLAAHATIPVINALSDREHPIQAFADLLTIQEYCGPLENHPKLAYVGDGNNVLHALLLACARMGVHLSAACPEDYFPDRGYVSEALRIATENGVQSEVISDPKEAVRNADAVYTDVWASMGQEEERAERARIFAPYQLNAELISLAKPGAKALHCLPAHRGEEITDEVMDAHKDSILEQAENRLHTQKALLILILGL